MRQLARLFALPLVAALGCGGAARNEGAITETPIARDLEAGEAPEAPAKRVCTDPAYAIARADLDEILAAGPAAVLASVQTDSVMEGGRFAGFRIVSFRVEVNPCLDLREGDVVAKVNGASIERPEHFFAVFEALRKATELRLDLVRDGEPLTLSYPIAP